MPSRSSRRASKLRAAAAAVCGAFALVTGATAAQAQLGKSELQEAFSNFQADFNKVYTDAVEEAHRYEISSENVMKVQLHNMNDAPAAGYTMGINQFSDYRPEEYRALLGYDEAAKTPNTLSDLNTNDLAGSIDWTSKGAVTAVKNQEHCGSCWAFSATGAMEGALAIKDGVDAQSVSLSEEELIDCSGSYGNEGCKGGLLDQAFQYVKDKGDDTEESYIYGAGAGYVQKCNTARQAEANGIPAGRITGIKDVKPNSCPDLMAAVNKGPVSVAIEADQLSFQSYNGGILTGECGPKLDHGVLVVGYGTDGGIDYWKVKNSWGASWGKRGTSVLQRNVMPLVHRLILPAVDCLVGQLVTRDSVEF